jgi:hypothetical protein
MRRALWSERVIRFPGKLKGPPCARAFAHGAQRTSDIQGRYSLSQLTDTKPEHASVGD